MEPDDRIALLLLAAEFPSEIAFVGTTVMHAGRKQVLADQFLDRIGLPGIPAIQGTGGEAASYPEIASSKAALGYQSEGHSLLPEADLALINRDMPRSSDFLNRADFVTRIRPVDITLDLNNIDTIKGFNVKVKSDLNSRIEIVEALDTRVFRQQVLNGLQQIAATMTHSSAVSLTPDCQR